MSIEFRRQLSLLLNIKCNNGFNGNQENWGFNKFTSLGLWEYMKAHRYFAFTRLWGNIIINNAPKVPIRHFWQKCPKWHIQWLNAKEYMHSGMISFNKRPQMSLFYVVCLCQSDLSQGDELCGADFWEKLWGKVRFNSWLMISGRCIPEIRDYLQWLPINFGRKKSESLFKSFSKVHKSLPVEALPRLSAMRSRFWSSNWFLQTNPLWVLLVLDFCIPAQGLLVVGRMQNLGLWVQKLCLLLCILCLYPILWPWL